MRQSERTHSVRRYAHTLAAVCATMIALSGCSSSDNTDGPGSQSAATGSTATESAQSGETASDPAAAAKESSPPASTAPPPVAQYPADPAQDPVVDLGPPPPAYQAPRPECPVEAKACVDLTNSMTWLQVNGALTYGPVQLIAGRDGYRTTPGMHEVIWKHIDHVSSEFGDPMPYAVFFTTTGMAFHEGPLTTPSHGCVHLPQPDVSVYWDNLSEGDLVYVFGEAQY